MRYYSKRFMLLPLFCLSLNMGCVSIQRSPNVALSKCQMRQVCAEDACPLYDRGEVVKQWTRRLNPMQWVPGCVHDWTTCHISGCVERKHRMQAWIARKKEEANEPPWPKFHPVPTKPVFEPDTDSHLNMPSEYGTFARQ